MTEKKVTEGPQPYQTFSFVVGKVLPATDPLAVDLLRLMAAYNDVTEIVEWMHTTKSAPMEPAHVARLRLSVQYRLFLSLLHESLEVVREIQGLNEFKKIEKTTLSRDARNALNQIRNADKGEVQLRKKLSVLRKKVGFHYDRSEFQQALKRYPKVFLEKDGAKARMVLRGDGRAYYPLAETLRELAAFGFQDTEDMTRVSEKVSELIAPVVKVHGALVEFLDGLMIAYMEYHGLRDELTEVAL